MQNIVAVTRKIPQQGMSILEAAGFKCLVNEQDRPLSRDELFLFAGKAEAMITMLYDRIDAGLLDAAPRLKIVANHAVGTDNIDLQACTDRRVAVTNTPGVLTEATADLTLGLILAAARNLVEADRFMRSGLFKSWDPLLFLGPELRGKTLGIIGMGRIGQAVARRALACGMKIVYFSRNRHDEGLEKRLEARYLPLDEVVCEADILTLHLPYSQETHHLIDRRRLNLMKPGAYLINTARGAHVDEKSLVDCLKKGLLAGAALDVYEDEPLMAPGLAELKNVTLLPHLGSATVEARNAMATMAAESVCAVLSGKRPEHLVNRLT